MLILLEDKIPLDHDILQQQYQFNRIILTFTFKKARILVPFLKIAIKARIRNQIYFGLELYSPNSGKIVSPHNYFVLYSDSNNVAPNLYDRIRREICN